jgi:hypothetical protein
MYIRYFVFCVYMCYFLAIFRHYLYVCDGYVSLLLLLHFLILSYYIKIKIN